MRLKSGSRLWVMIQKKIASVEAIQIPTRIRQEDVENMGLNETFEDLMRFKKADAQIRIVITIGKTIKVENLSLKKANSNAD